MHIPDIRNVADNFVNHPTMMATKKTNDGSEEIIGIATMKFENNNSMNSNPVFPTKNENILFITGVLTKNYELSPEEVPVDFRFVDEIPFLSNGKPNYQQASKDYHEKVLKL